MAKNGRVIRTEEVDFNTKDPGFYLDARLTAIVNGTAYDFMGKSIFSVGFFRQGVGFGIINIDVEINTSLQPVITITFKDLYGNAVFGKSVNTLLTNQISQAISDDKSTGTIDGSKKEDISNDDLNFSVLFNWPPPKFLFTFKGYLGKQVSWLLNLKQTSTTYQSDGSYDIKCEFVPNQWGFMSDLPFLFLLAVKGLKRNELGEEAFKKVRSVFDLIKIGKQVEVKTKETSKEFDVLLKQMTLLKANRIFEAVNISKVIKFDEVVTGAVGVSNIKNFSDVKINKPSDAKIGDIERLKVYTTGNAENLRRVNIYLLLTAKIGKYDPISISDVSSITLDNGVSLGGESQEGEIKKRASVISDNILLIEDAIKQKTYDSSKVQLEQITIGEIFGQLSQDAGYIMGRILQAGFQAYKANDTARNASTQINGKQYPLRFDKDQKEIPATGLGLGVEEGELAFVDLFISAISEGIAKDLIRDDQTASDESRLIKRINNIEGGRGNPYSPSFRNIAENIMVRSGIIGYLTRSGDPNFPGDYDTTWGGDRDSPEEILKLADADMENISVGLLSTIPDDEFSKLKDFCIFWTRFLDAGDNTIYYSLTDLLPTEMIPLSFPEQTQVYEDLPDSFLDAKVVLEKDSNGNPQRTLTLRQIINQVFKAKKTTGGGFDSSNTSFIELASLHARRIFNNGIIYEVPHKAKGGDIYVFVLFRGPDAAAVKEANSSASDAEAKNINPDAENTFTGSVWPIGYTPIESYYQQENPSEALVRIQTINDRFSSGVLKYENMVNPRSELFTDDTNTNPDWFDISCTYPDEAAIVPPEEEITNSNLQIESNNVVYSMAIHADGNDGGLVFGPFDTRTVSGRNHRICIRQMCQNLLEKMNKLEEEKNRIISEVLGKGTEQREAMYKQFHVLYHQWESLMYEDPEYDDVKNITSIEPNPKEVANNFEKNYTKTRSDSKSSETDTSKENKHRSTRDLDEIESIGRNSFIYDYPLNKQANIDVRNSIINLDPLYKPNGNTTVLNIIQQVCTKNNFIFIPIPGNGDFSSEETYFKIYQPHVSTKVKLTNYFYVMFTATPQERSTISNDDPIPISNDKLIQNIPTNAYEIKVGSVYNKVIKGLSIDTNENKTTAESIVNLQRLVDKENQNKKVTTDCSMLPVMEGRSYKASFDMLGNAQIFPMQYFFLNSIPMFNGLYQVLKVKHNMKPNDMTTTAEGIRMRFDSNTGDFGGIPPVTLEVLSGLNVFGDDKPEKNVEAEIRQYNEESAPDDQYVETGSVIEGPISQFSGTTSTNQVSTSEIIVPAILKSVAGSGLLSKQSNSGSSNGPITNFSYGEINVSKAQRIKNMNAFIEDVLGPFATYLSNNYPDLYKKLTITSTIRSYVPNGGSTTSEHFLGKAIDMGLAIGDFEERNKQTFRLLNALMEFYGTTSFGWGQILFETYKSYGWCWIHWSYTRGGNRNNLARFVNNSTYKAPMNNSYQGNNPKRSQRFSTTDVILYK